MQRYTYWCTTTRYIYLFFSYSLQKYAEKWVADEISITCFVCYSIL